MCREHWALDNLPQNFMPEINNTNNTVIFYKVSRYTKEERKQAMEDFREGGRFAKYAYLIERPYTTKEKLDLVA